MMEVMRSNFRRMELPMEDVIVANALLFADDVVAEGVTAGGASILPTSSDDVGCGCGPGLGVGVVVVMNREVIMVNPSLA